LSVFLTLWPGTLVPIFGRKAGLPASAQKQQFWPEIAVKGWNLQTLEPPHQSNGRLGQVGEIVAGQASELEVRDLINVPAILSAERQIFGHIEINAAAVNERSLGLVVTASLANADEIIIQRIGRTEEKPANSGQPVRAHAAA